MLKSRGAVYWPRVPQLGHGTSDRLSSAVATAKLLGDLRPHLEDLIPDAAGSGLVPRRDGTLAPATVHEQAVRRWARGRREALTGLVGISVITWTIWAATMLGGFPWPIFPMLAAAVNLVRMQINKQDIVEEHERKALAREAKALRKRQELERGFGADD